MKVNTQSFDEKAARAAHSAERKRLVRDVNRTVNNARRAELRKLKAASRVNRQGVLS